VSDRAAHLANQRRARSSAGSGELSATSSPITARRAGSGEERGAEARELISVLPATVSRDEGVSDCDGGELTTAGPGVASLGDILGLELQHLVGTVPESFPELEERAPPQIQVPSPATVSTPSFRFVSEDFPSLLSGGSGRNLTFGSSSPATVLLVGEVPIWAAAVGAPPPSDARAGQGLGFPCPPAAAVLGLGSKGSFGPFCESGPTGLGPPAVSTGERLDSCHVSQGQKETVQIDVGDLGHRLSVFAPMPPVHKWIWLRVGT
jgi:hypothetical protein